MRISQAKPARRRFRAAMLCGVAWFHVACAPSRMPGAAAPPAPNPTTPRALLVGAARVDITPPPGPATFGHGPDSLATEGYWTRLGCRAFVFESAGADNRHALVSCDLGAVSHLLQREAAKLLTEEVHVSRLMITATIHDWTRSSWTSETSVAEINNLSARGSRICPSVVICPRRRAR